MILMLLWLVWLYQICSDFLFAMTCTVMFTICNIAHPYEMIIMDMFKKYFEWTDTLAPISLGGCNFLSFPFYVRFVGVVSGVCDLWNCPCDVSKTITTLFVCLLLNIVPFLRANICLMVWCLEGINYAAFCRGLLVITLDRDGLYIDKTMHLYNPTSFEKPTYSCGF